MLFLVHSDDIEEPEGSKCQYTCRGERLKPTSLSGGGRCIAERLVCPSKIWKTLEDYLIELRLGQFSICDNICSNGVHGFLRTIPSSEKLALPFSMGICSRIGVSTTGHGVASS